MLCCSRLAAFTFALLVSLFVATAVVPALGCYLQMLRPGVRTRAHRERRRSHHRQRLTALSGHLPCPFR